MKGQGHSESTYDPKHLGDVSYEALVRISPNLYLSAHGADWILRSEVKIAAEFASEVILMDGSPLNTI